MAFIKAERFVQLLQEPLPPQRGQEGYIPITYYGNIRRQIELAVGLTAISGVAVPAQVDRASAMAVLNTIRNHVAETGRFDSKVLRPWNVDPQLYNELDRSEPWWGWEFETGWRSQESRAEAIRHTWDTWDNVVFDGEGEGGNPVEITFAPQEVSKYLDGTANAYQFAEYLCANRHTYNGGHSYVGTHINISHPDMQTPESTELIMYGMNRTIAHLPVTANGRNVRYDLFGRDRLYAGFYVGEGPANWVEGKIFRTTYDIAQFRMYIRVATALTKCMSALLRHNTNGAFVDNLLEMVEDETVEPNVVDDKMRVRGFDSAYGEFVNGALARDVFYYTDPDNEPDLYEDDYDDYYDDYDDGDEY